MTKGYESPIDSMIMVSIRLSLDQLLGVSSQEYLRAIQMVKEELGLG